MNDKLKQTNLVDAWIPKWEIFEIVSSHPDYTPTEADFAIARHVFTHHFSYVATSHMFGAHAVVLAGADDSGYLWWTDGQEGYNCWCEHYATVSEAIARLAVLQNCAESGWHKWFDDTPKDFSDKFIEFCAHTQFPEYLERL